MTDITVRPVPVEATRPFRERVLRPGAPPEASVYPGDSAPDAWHVGAFDGERLVGVASIFAEPMPGDAAQGAWRLRGVAVEPQQHRRGFGRALIGACLDHVARQGGTLLWCNARADALPFYHSLGFRAHGPPFDIPDGGTHYRLARPVAPADRIGTVMIDTTLE